LPSLTGDRVETAFRAAFDTGAALAIADLRGEDPDRYRRIRMLDYFMDLPVAQALDAVACVPETRSVSGIETKR
jgi:hypothetical protein